MPGGFMLTGTIALTVATGFSLLACFIYWVYIRLSATAENTVPATPPARKKTKTLPIIILILLVLFIFLASRLLNYTT